MLQGITLVAFKLEIINLARLSSVPWLSMLLRDFVPRRLGMVSLCSPDLNGLPSRASHTSCPQAVRSTVVGSLAFGSAPGEITDFHVASVEFLKRRKLIVSAVFVTSFCSQAVRSTVVGSLAFGRLTANS